MIDLFNRDLINKIENIMDFARSRAEYGATLAEADAAEARTLKEIQADRKSGKVFEFTGKLP